MESGIRVTRNLAGPSPLCVRACDARLEFQGVVKGWKGEGNKYAKKKTNKIVRRRPAIGSRERNDDESGLCMCVFMGGGFKLSIFRRNIIYVFVIYYSYLLLEIKFVTWHCGSQHFIRHLEIDLAVASSIYVYRLLLV